MVQMTIEVPEALAERLAAVRERLPEVLAHGLDALSPLPMCVRAVSGVMPFTEVTCRA